MASDDPGVPMGSRVWTPTATSSAPGQERRGMCADGDCRAHRSLLPELPANLAWAEDGSASPSPHAPACTGWRPGRAEHSPDLAGALPARRLRIHPCASRILRGRRSAPRPPPLTAQRVSVLFAEPAGGGGPGGRRALCFVEPRARHPARPPTLQQNLVRSGPGPAASSCWAPMIRPRHSLACDFRQPGGPAGRRALGGGGPGWDLLGGLRGLRNWSSRGGRHRHRDPARVPYLLLAIAVVVQALGPGVLNTTGSP